MNYHLIPTEDVLKDLGTSENGLTSSEAARRLAENGKNKLTEAKKDSLAKRLFNQLKDPMLIILIVAAVLSGFTAVYAGESFADAIIIGIVVIVNAVLGVYQENKADKAIEALQEMSAATSKVLRDGAVTSVKSEDIVVGDILILEAGDAVGADARLIEAASMKCEEAALTGESVPVNKNSSAMQDNGENISLGDRHNMVYMGSSVSYGRGSAVVTATGMDTQMGMIAGVLAQSRDEQTPLQKKLGQLSKTLTYLVVGISAFIFVFRLMSSENTGTAGIIDTFMVAVSLAVAAIPEGLATVVTIVLSIGVTNMSKRNAIIRRLSSVETLGCARIICSDKTGTLTQNKMTVVDTFTTDDTLLAKAMCLCNDATIQVGEEAKGEATEAALVNYANSLGMVKYRLENDFPRVSEAPFDSDRKMMSTVHRLDENDRFVQYTKGACEIVIDRCTHYYDNGNVYPITEEYKQKIMDSAKSFADRALRVLAAAYKYYDGLPGFDSPDEIEKDLVFIGFTGMIDPVRPEVKDAIIKARQAGIRPIMITGDHIDTAKAIAKELGILDENKKAITGNELSVMSDEEYNKELENITVYARVQPEHKVRIVNAWRNAGYVTAMTGDGVNDAPSIKSADIGVGMGITGTDVTKNVADMILADDNFATIVSAVEEGRRIYDNIRKAIQFLLSSNMSEVISIFVSTVLGFTILHPVHILWINLVTDCFPALALGLEKAEDDIMKRPPRDSEEGVFAGGMGFDVVYQGILVSALTLSAYFIGHYMESGVWEIAQSRDGITMAFLTMSFAEIFHSLNMRSQRGSIFKMHHSNRTLTFAAIGSFIATNLVVYVPFLAKAFEFEHISSAEYIVALLLGVSVIPVVEIVKAVQRKRA
ncbi:MAG: calcium-translocating P-type ATPase, PMCA-type [Anaerofustis stercorihominis]|nr:calcium-translocating P-type ATPase, PMCA-type [Anaerofustis stercorihominis]